MRYVVFNRKGGVGKTSLVCNLAAVSAAEGWKTLVIDLDPQANSSHYLLGHEACEALPNAADFFEHTLGFQLFGDVDEGDAWVHETPFENLWLLPADHRLAEIQPKLESRYKIYKLRDLLNKLADFDAIFLDTPPATSFFTTSALIAADSCLIPFDCDEFSRRALYQLLGTVREVREDHNEEIEIGGIVVNLFQEQARLPRRLVDELESEGLPVLRPYINASVKVRESHEQHRPLVHLAPSHKVTRQFRDLYQTLVEQAA
ncbi:MAG: ParA family protein [bacterium]|nr:ParA family protein [bacterium]